MALTPAEVGGLKPATAYRYRLFTKNVLGQISGPEATFNTFPTPIAGLPDQRAYEQVSPLDKDGGDITGTVVSLKASADGEHVTFRSSSGVPGGEGAQDLPLYLASRGNEEWSSQGLLPPGGLAPKASVIGWLPDFSETYAEATKFGLPPTFGLFGRSSTAWLRGNDSRLRSQRRLFLRRGVGRRSVVYFESTTKLPSVDGAVEGKPNLYYWDKATGELGLAGALNTNEAPGEGAFAGPYDWIKGTTSTALSNGGAARDYYIQEDHAIAKDGSVYFTEAGSGRLLGASTRPRAKRHERRGMHRSGEGVHGGDLGLAKDQRRRPRRHRCGGQAPGRLHRRQRRRLEGFLHLGREADRRRHHRPRTRPARRGEGGESAGEGVEPTFMANIAATGMASDGTYLYWANPGKGTIGRSTLGGGEVNESFVTDAGTPQYVAVDGEHIYWTNAADGQEGNGTIGRADIADGGGANLDFISGANNPQGIAVNATHIFWANANAGTPSIGRAAIGGEVGSVEEEWHPIGDGNEQPQGVALRPEPRLLDR